MIPYILDIYFFHEMSCITIIYVIAHLCPPLKLEKRWYANMSEHHEFTGMI